MSRQATEDRLLALADHLPAEAAEALLELATGGKPARCPVSPRAAASASPVRSSGCPAPLPRDGECGGTGARPRFPVGEVDGLPASRATAMGGAGLHRPSARLRFSRHRQDHRRAASGRLSGAHASRRPRPADDLLRHAGQCAANQAEAAAWATNRGWRNGSTFIRSTPSVFGFTRRTSGRRRLPAAEVHARADERGRERRGRPQVQPAFSAHRMGAGGRCLAVGELGGVSRCRAARQKDAASGGAAQGAVVHLRARARRAEKRAS